MTWKRPLLWTAHDKNERCMQNLRKQRIPLSISAISIRSKALNIKPNIQYQPAIFHTLHGCALHLNSDAARGNKIFVDHVRRAANWNSIWRARNYARKFASLAAVKSQPAPMRTLSRDRVQFRREPIISGLCVCVHVHHAAGWRVTFLRARQQTGVKVNFVRMVHWRRWFSISHSHTGHLKFKSRLVGKSRRPTLVGAHRIKARVAPPE